MAINVDLSKPLTEKQIADLRTRLPNEIVDHYIAQSNGEFGALDEDAVDEEEKKPVARTTAAKSTTAAKKDDGDIMK